MVEWKYISPLRVGTEVEVLELKYYNPVPDDLKECIKQNNGGMPSLARFSLSKKELIFGGLLSFNAGDNDSIYDFIAEFETGDKSRLTMLPFGLDPFGNFFCIKDQKVVFFDHESDSVIPIADTFSAFLDALHD